MINAPQMSVLYRRTGDTMFGWDPLSKTDAISYNLYSASAIAGPYILVKSGILNNVDRNKKKVVIIVKDSDIPIPPLVRYYFKLTYISPTNVESNIALSYVTTIFPPDIHPYWENEAEEANNHNYAWVEENQRWEKLILTPDGKLKVDANISIGAVTLSNVQIATLPDGTTKVYVLADNQKRIIVSEDPTVFSRLQSFEEHLSIVSNTETTILTFTNAQAFFVSKIVCSGTADAIFKMKINNVTNQVMRNSWNNRNVTFDFTDKALAIPAGTTVTITVKHEERLAQDFEVSIYSFTYAY
jgi:hypothetical protein